MYDSEVPLNFIDKIFILPGYSLSNYSAPSLESPLSVRVTISLFQSAENPNFNTVFAYWHSTTGGICNAPMCIIIIIDHRNKP